MYVAVKGGEKAIANAHALLAKRGAGGRGAAQQRAEQRGAGEGTPGEGSSGEDQGRIAARQVRDQMGVLVSRVMNEGSLYDPDLAAKALLQAQGDVLEAITLLRSYRTTLPRFGITEPLDTGELPAERRISATFKDIPGGQQLGATFDYTHRLLAEELEVPELDLPTNSLPGAGGSGADRPGSGEPASGSQQGRDHAAHDDAASRRASSTSPDPGGGLGSGSEPGGEAAMPRVTDLLGRGALVEPDHPEDWKDPDPGDLTREPTTFPMTRAERLQALARGDEGFLLSLGYSTQRGFGNTHPFAGEVRVGEVEVLFDAPETDGAEGLPIGRIEITECQMVNQFVGSSEKPPQFTRGYGLSFGRAERKAMSMALVDRSLRAEEFGERQVSPAQDEEFVIAHADNVAATGFVEHLKLPHYVDFQAELVLIRQLGAEFAARRGSAPEPSGDGAEENGRAKDDDGRSAADYRPDHPADHPAGPAAEEEHADADR